MIGEGKRMDYMFAKAVGEGYRQGYRSGNGNASRRRCSSAVGRVESES